MSIRLRLTLMYSLILALVLVIFSTVLYVAQTQYTLSIVESDLSQAAMGAVAGLPAGWPEGIPRRGSLLPNRHRAGL